MSNDINLLSSDREPFELDIRAVGLMSTLANLIDDLGDSDDPIPLMMVDSSTLKDVLEYTNIYLSAPFPALPEGEVRKLSDWEKDLFSGPWSRVNNIMLAANFLQYDILLQACAQFIASQIVKMSPEDIKEYCSS
jgi:hypothetical protein